MPIGNITQDVSIIPAPPHRGVDVQTVFVTKQEDFQDHLQGTTVTELNTLKDQLNTIIGEINSTATTMNGYADTASAGASTATTKAGEASTSASEALTSRNQAETFKNNASASATKASQWADNNYNVEVETGRYSAKHWATEANNVISTALAGKANNADVNTQLSLKANTADLALKANTADLKEIGVGQTWQDVSASRGYGFTYTNTTGKPIFFALTNFSSGNSNQNMRISAYVNGSLISTSGIYINANGGDNYPTISCIVPNGATYKAELTGPCNGIIWQELK